MTHTVYGLRLKGDPEVRYVGLTCKDLKRRLRQHRTGGNSPLLSPWLRENSDEVEIFPIAAVECREEATATEKVMIALCCRLDHRLFNRAHNPKWSQA